MKKYLSLIFLWTVLGVACKHHHKVNLEGNGNVKMSDFITAYPKLRLPLDLSDSSLSRLDDTTSISYEILSRFIPDSVLDGDVKDARTAAIRLMGKITKEKENYLLTLFSHGRHRQLMVFVLNKKDQFMAEKELLRNDYNDGYRHSININKEPTFLMHREKTDKNKQLLFTEIGWVYNEGSNFMVVINDGNEDKQRNDEIINPIDTLPALGKLSGNYVKDPKNFIAIRDGRDANTYRFFIHFEKKEGTCTGELKGTLKISAANGAVYKESGDPCSLSFVFNQNEVTIKETGGCGNHRGMQCSFNDTYEKKKMHKKNQEKIKKATVKKRTTMQDVL